MLLVFAREFAVNIGRIALLCEGVETGERIADGAREVEVEGYCS